MDSFYFSGPHEEGSVSRKGAKIISSVIKPYRDMERSVEIFSTEKGAKRAYRARLKGAKKSPDYFVDENS